MKILFAALLVLSLAGNFVAGYRWLQTAPAVPPPSASSAPTAGAATPPPTNASPATATAAVRSGESRRPPGRRKGALPPWSALNTSDPRALAAQLRAAGVPEATVRAIVTAVLNDEFGRKMRPLYDSVAISYWKARPATATRDRMLVARAWDKERKDLLRELFGDAREPAERMRLQQRFHFLPAEKVERVAEIENDYGDMQSDVMLTAVGARLPPDMGNLALLEQEKLADLAAVLSPEELELYELYLSNTANSLRSRMGVFEPTAEEFRAVFALQQVFDEEYGQQYSPPDPATTRQRQADQQALDEQIASVLGPERYREFQRGGDVGYRSAVAITDHFNLPRENAAAVYDLQKELQDRATELRRSAPPQEREATHAAITALIQEANEKLAPLLTPAGLDAYRETGGGWLRNLERSTRPPPPRPVPPGGNAGG